jgi:fructose-1-phosphate kinase PfkB-like protein
MAKPPKVQAISTVGAGDSMIAGFLAAYSWGETLEKCLKRAVAYGTAACLTEGTLPPKPADVEQIYNQVEVTA